MALDLVSYVFEPDWELTAGLEVSECKQVVVLFVSLQETGELPWMLPCLDPKDSWDRLGCH